MKTLNELNELNDWQQKIAKLLSTGEETNIKLAVELDKGYDGDRVTEYLCQGWSEHCHNGFVSFDKYSSQPFYSKNSPLDLKLGLLLCSDRIHLNVIPPQSISLLCSLREKTRIFVNYVSFTEQYTWVNDCEIDLLTIRNISLSELYQIKSKHIKYLCLKINDFPTQEEIIKRLKEINAPNLQALNIMTRHNCFKGSDKILEIASYFKNLISIVVDGKHKTP